MQDELSQNLKENLMCFDDFSEIQINDHGWVIAKSSHMNKNVAFRINNASNEEITNLGKKYYLTIQEDGMNSNKTFRMVRGNNVKECLTAYFELIPYHPRSVIRKEFDSIELIEKDLFWIKNSQENVYSAIKDNATIFVTYDHGIYERLIFKKNQSFRIENDFIIVVQT